MDTHSLDGGQFKTYAPNGCSETATITVNGFYDPDGTVLTAYHALTAAPVATNFKITYTDTTPYSRIYAGAGFGIDKTVSISEAVKFSASIKTSGAPA